MRTDAPDASEDEDEGDESDLDGFVVVDVVLRCATCGRALVGDPDEDPTGDAGRPICGECERERNFFAMDYADGDLDGRID
jgi:hypothetical protein